jgi:hypothetical protein
MDGVADETSTPSSPQGSRPRFNERVRMAAEQAGFRFQPAKVKVDTAVIDRVERPSEH